MHTHAHHACLGGHGNSRQHVQHAAARQPGGGRAGGSPRPATPPTPTQSLGSLVAGFSCPLADCQDLGMVSSASASHVHSVLNSTVDR